MKFTKIKVFKETKELNPSNLVEVIINADLILQFYSTEKKFYDKTMVFTTIVMTDRLLFTAVGTPEEVIKEIKKGEIE